MKSKHYPAYLEFATASNFSFLRGASHPEELMAQAEHLGLAGLGLCDRNTVAGVVRAHLAKREKEFALRYHPGARLVFADGMPDVLAYPRDRAGWGRLCRLLTVGNLRAEKGDCILHLDDLLAHAEGLELVVMEASTWDLPVLPLLRGNKLSGDVVAAPLASPPPLAGEGQGGGTNDHPNKLTPSPALPRKWGREHAVPCREIVSPNHESASKAKIRLVAGSREKGRDAKASLFARLRDAAPGRVRLAAAMLYRGGDRARLAARTALAREAGVPAIAVNDVLYHHPDRRPLQDVLTCIREHMTIDTAGRRLAVNAERFLKSADEMVRLFRDAPETIEETLKLSAELSFSLDELRYEYPDETIEGFATAQDALVHLAFEGAARRYPQGVPEKVRASIEHELRLIAELQYAPYFLTVYDIVRFARAQHILCQGRGSAANSAVCFCLGITEVDPERADLLFERFISPERREPPDIDVDFEHERREEVIQYIYARYGRERAGIAATVISYRGRSAIREVGKAFALSEDTIGALASSIWGSGGGRVADDDLARAGLDAASPRIRQVRALCAQIQSFPRHLSQHVGGFVITRSRLDEVMPIMNAAMEERTNVEWDKDDLDALGILKIDVLGLGMLTCIRKALDLVEKHYGDAFSAPAFQQPAPLPLVGRGRGWGSDDEAMHSSCTTPLPTPPPQGGREQAAASGSSIMQSEGKTERLDLSIIPPEDPAVYRMLQRADSLGVFQVESRAQMTMLPRLKPENFYDLVIEVAIVRPGPIQGDMVHPYLRRRQKIEPVSYPSKELEAVLGKTLGVPLFQEQAMKIAIVAAGFTPAEADRLRRAMATFKRVGTIGTFARKMVDGMLTKGYEREFAERCFHQIEGFGEYGFPESHAASFALLVYASAWLKCHYPDVFAAALLNAQPMGFYAPAQIVRDAREHGVEVRAVDINHSDWDALLEPGARAAGRVHALHHEMAGDILTTHGMRLGFREIKGLKENDARLIVAQRAAGYDSVRDVWLRTMLAPRVIERLADADAFGSLGLTRREALWAAKSLGRVGDRADDLPLFRSSAKISASILSCSAKAEHPVTTEMADEARTLDPSRAADTGLPACAGNDSERWHQEPDVHLPPMPLGEEVVNDYHFLRLSLRAHPAAFLRADLAQRRIVTNETLRTQKSGTRVAISGLVTCRQRPGSAKGVIFMTIEDETAFANVIVWPATFERFRPIVLGARYVAVTGRMQEECGVIHVVADRLEDLTSLLARLADGPAVEALARCDEVRRPTDDQREKRAAGGRSRLLSLLTDMPELASDLDVPARGSAHAPNRRTLPKT